MDFFNDQPFLLQWLPKLDQGLVLAINRVGQIFIVTAAFMGLFIDKLPPLISISLKAISTAIREVAAGVGWRWSRDEIGFEFPREKPLTDEQISEDFQIGKQLALSSVLLIVLLTISDRGPLGWLLFAFEILWHAITVWFDVQLDCWSIICTFGGSIGRLIGFLPLVYLSMLACAIVVRPYAFVLSRIADYFSHGLYRIVAAIVLLTGSFFVIITT
ncbi:MAG: hypothetical protein AB1325_00090 [Nitrospirota bacterium]